MPDITPTQVLPALRIAVGGGAWAAPEMTSKLFGFTNTQESAYLARLFGVRDVALGLGVLVGGDGRRMWLTMGVLCDAADAAAGVLGLQAGASKRAMIMSTATACLATGLGIAALIGTRGASPVEE
jgi:hypothetical protein